MGKKNLSDKEHITSFGEWHVKGYLFERNVSINENITVADTKCNLEKLYKLLVFLYI